jgi:DNA-binding transcriptional LysR family regulator
MDLQATLPNLLTFCHTMELGSFSAAARKLGVTPQAASRSVQRLEDTLGFVLFRRTTRSLTPTEAAVAYYGSAKAALGLLERAETEASQRNVVRGGVVRLSVPTTFGHHRLLPALVPFHERFPGIELDVHVGNRNVDLAREGYDFAIRMGKSQEKGLIARKLGDYALGVYAAPGYLARRGTPKTPTDITDHTCIAFTMPSTGRELPWVFSREPHSLRPNAGVRCSEDVLATVTLARAGMGLIQTYQFLVEKDVERGLLVEVLHDFRGQSRPFSLIYPGAPRRTPAARSLIDYLLAVRL